MRTKLARPDIAFKVDANFNPESASREGWVLRPDGAQKVEYAKVTTYQCSIQLRALSELFLHISSADSNIDPEKLSGIEETISHIAYQAEKAQAALDEALTLPENLERAKTRFEELIKIRSLLVGKE